MIESCSKLPKSSSVSSSQLAKLLPICFQACMVNLLKLAWSLPFLSLRSSQSPDSLFYCSMNFCRKVMASEAEFHFSLPLTFARSSCGRVSLPSQSGLNKEPSLKEQLLHFSTSCLQSKISGQHFNKQCGDKTRQTFRIYSQQYL